MFLPLFFFPFGIAVQDYCGVVQEVRRAHREDLFKDAVDEMCVREHMLRPICPV
jgi:hypothetical protein